MNDDTGGTKTTTRAAPWCVFYPDGKPVVWSCAWFRGQAFDQAAQYCMAASDYERRDKLGRRALLRRRGFKARRVRIVEAGK